MINFTFEEMFNGIELLSEISQEHYKLLKYQGIEDEMRIMHIDGWKIFYTPTEHSNIRIGQRIETFPAFVQYKCASTYFKNIKHFNNGYGRINGILYLFGYKDIPLNQCIVIPYEIQYDSNEKVAEIVSKTIALGYPTKGEEATKNGVTYDNIKAASFKLSTTGSEISDDIMMNDNIIVNGKNFKQTFKMKELLNQTTYLVCKQYWNNIQMLSNKDIQPNGIVHRFKKN